MGVGVQQRSSLIARLGSPRLWPAADKCLLVIAIMLPFAGTFTALMYIADGWPFMGGQIAASVVTRVARDSIAVVGGWCVLLCLGLVLRTHRPHSKVLVYLTIVYYAITTAFFAFATGPLHMPGGFSVLGGIVVGLLLFDRTVVVVGTLSWCAAMAAIALLSSDGMLPYGELVEAMNGGRPIAAATILRVGVLSTFLATFIALLCAAVIAHIRDQEQRLDHLAKIDDLTGIPNRRQLMDLFEHELRQASRYERPLAVIVIDLDHFKDVNDEYGHVVGDEVLAATARALAAGLRDADVLGRYGGEEFVLLLPNTDTAGAREVAERCRISLHDVAVRAGHDTISVTASMGVASFPDIDTVDELLTAADNAMYAAKSGGRDRVCAA